MTAIVFAISMFITWLSTLMAMTDNFTANLLSQPVIKYKIFPFEFIKKIFFFNLIGIINNTSFQMKYIFKSIMQHISAGFFATDTACAIHDNILSFLSCSILTAIGNCS